MDDTIALRPEHPHRSYERNTKQGNVMAHGLSPAEPLNIKIYSEDTSDINFLRSDIAGIAFSL